MSGRAASHLLALSVLLGRDSRALGVVCPSFGLFVVLGLGDWCLEGCGVLAPLPPCARALLSPSTLEGRFGGCRSQGCHGYPTRSARFPSWPSLLSRHHSPRFSIVDDLNVAKCNLG